MVSLGGVRGFDGFMVLSGLEPVVVFRFFTFLRRVDLPVALGFLRVGKDLTATRVASFRLVLPGMLG